MKIKNIIAWIFIGLGVLVAFYSAFVIFYSCSRSDSYSCSFGGMWALVGLIWFASPLILIGLMIFLISWIVQKIKSRKQNNLVS